MGLTDYAVAAGNVITEKFASATKPDGAGTRERAAYCGIGTRTSSWGQGKKIS